MKKWKCIIKLENIQAYEGTIDVNLPVKNN